MFMQMIEDTNQETIKRIFRTNIEKRDTQSSASPRNINLSHDKMPINFAAPPSGQAEASADMARSRPPKVKPVESGKKYGRNDKVTISNGSETKILKYKKAESLIEQGWNIID